MPPRARRAIEGRPRGHMLPVNPQMQHVRRGLSFDRPARPMAGPASAGVSSRLTHPCLLCLGRRRVPVPTRVPRCAGDGAHTCAGARTCARAHVRTRAVSPFLKLVPCPPSPPSPKTPSAPSSELLQNPQPALAAHHPHDHGVEVRRRERLAKHRDVRDICGDLVRGGAVGADEQKGASQ